MAKSVCFVKHLCYFLYVVLFPLRAKLPLGGIFFLANICSLINRKLTMKSKDSFLQLLLADEEAMHAIWFLTYLLLGWQLKIFVDFMFLAWSLLNTTELLDYLMLKHPGMPIIGLFGSLVQLS